jgi:S1-C subfamily serine protease
LKIPWNALNRIDERIAMPGIRCSAVGLLLLALSACEEPATRKAARLPAEARVEPLPRDQWPAAPPDDRPPPRPEPRPAPRATEAPKPTASPAPDPPAVAETKWSGIVLRVEFRFRETGQTHLGTGFVLRDAFGQDYLMTCAHLISGAQWENRYGVSMRTMRGDRRIETLGESVHVGTSIDLRRPGPGGRPDMTQDLVIRCVDGDRFQPLPLAAVDPKVGDLVWAVGCEAGAPVSDERLFPGRIREIAGGGYVMRKLVPFDPRGFSGGPLVNSAGEVVGNVLAAGQDSVSGATASTLRRRLAESGIRVD